MKSAKDRDIVEYAGKHNLILVTQDQKPAELAELLGVKCVFISNLMIAKLVDEKIKQLALNEDVPQILVPQVSCRVTSH